MAWSGQERTPVSTAVQQHAELLHLPVKHVRESVRITRVIKQGATITINHCREKLPASVGGRLNSL